ncbi:hypothetical protein ACFWN2_41145 [Lentzea sp. NPDC058436]|uniref:hypothetical protein n=1 Tax=Lentzea sp. NPDC058436 TaxID=3346499 RepID=UPI00364AA4DC
MAGAVGIVFGLCVLSFTLGAALMYVLVRRREEAASAASDVSAPSEAPVDRTWVEKPVTVEPVDADYETRPIHRNPVVGLPHQEPALARLAERAEPKTVGAARYDRDGDLDPPLGVVEAPESSVAASTDIPGVADTSGPAEEHEPVAQPELPPEPQAQPVTRSEPTAEPEAQVESPPEPEVQPAPEPSAPPVTRATLPPPASPQPAEHTTWVEREDFRQRYLRTFEEVRRKAGSN